MKLAWCRTDQSRRWVKTSLGNAIAETLGMKEAPTTQEQSAAGIFEQVRLVSVTDTGVIQANRYYPRLRSLPRQRRRAALSLSKARIFRGRFSLRLIPSLVTLN